MANKGQKFKKYSSELKELILKEYYENYKTPRTLEENYGVPHKTIENWVYKTGHGIDVSVDRRQENAGRPSNNRLTIEDYKERYEILKKYQAFLQARQGKK
jgi:hypothetical protein